GDKLARDAGDLFNGEVWTGVNAQRLGLVDGLGTPREIIANRFPDAEPVLVEGRKPLLARLGVGAPAARGGAASLAEGLLQAAELRAAWARFGL
ncbi:MAG: S49 family peptidase, partial [Pseudonocardia sp.]|nr:S49 family peptidase [Pseudonocardia sp.]